MRELAITELSADEFLTGYADVHEERSQFLPNSRSAWEPLRTWEGVEPPPMDWVVADLIPAGYSTSLYGDGATGKSYLALILGMHVLLGIPFLGKRVTSGKVLFVDAELDQDEFLRRAFRVARALGLSKPPEGLFYLRLPESLANAHAMAEVAATISTISPRLTVLDSFNAAAFGADTNAASDVTAMMRGLGTWGTTLIIDHIPKQAPGANMSNVRAHGSAFKFNLSRSSISAVRADGGAITLRQTKSNFGPLVPPIYAALVFEDSTVSLETVAVDDARLAGAENHLTAAETVLFALRDRGVAGATPQEVAEKVGKSEKTVRNYLSKLKADGLAEPIDGSRWRVPIPNCLETGNGKE